MKTQDLFENPALSMSSKESNDLYNHISPPNPLVERNKYIDDLPKSYYSMLQLRRLQGLEKDYNTGDPTRYSSQLGPEISLFSLCEGKNSNVVYRRDPSSPPYNSNLLDLRKFITNTAKPAKSEPITDFYTPNENEKTLVFESRFESGNLSVAIKVSDNEYNLVLQNDINSKGNTQWFYFQVKNTSADLDVRFNLVNFTKKDSLYNLGMKVLVFSIKENEKNQLGWFRAGTGIGYYQNNIRRLGSSKCFYSLSFSYKFENANDVVYFAYSCPYTYSDLMQDLSVMEKDSFIKTIMSRKTICHSIGGNKCEMLSVTAPGTPEELNKRKGIVLTARVHPGETVGSWMMKGAIEFLTSRSSDAEILRQAYIFKIIPMLNPDGVIYGNYRCGLAGVDLNRRWKNPNKNLHPTIFHAKRTIKSFAKMFKIDLVCDMHGHSRRKNIFAYGCNIPQSPEVTRAYPYILSKLSQFFTYKFCSFKMQKAKESTLRITLFKEILSPFVYTLEASFCGADFGMYAGLHFSTSHLMEMGKQVCLALIVNAELSSPSDEPQPEGFGSAILFSKKDVMKELKENPELLQNNDDDCSSGSESDPSEDNLDPEEICSVYPVALAPKLKPTDKKKSTPIPNSKARAESNRSLTAQKERTKIILKCKICAEPDLPGHLCQKPKPKQPLRPIVKPSSSFGLVNQPYYNSAGKKVRDQATQTIPLSQTPLIKEESKIGQLELRNNTISPTKKEFKSSYRNSSTDEPPMIGKIWRQEKNYHSFSKNSRQNSAWKYSDAIKK